MSHPQMSPSFESKVLKALADALTDVGARIEVDGVDALESAHGRVVLVDFHLEGNWTSPAGFTFPFHESQPIDKSIGLLRDMVAKNCYQASQ